MNLATQLQLVRPRSATDRSRFRLLVLTTALAGAFLLAAWRIKRLGFDGDLRSQQYSNFIQEGGLRSGVALAAFLLAVASCLLAYQALRLGTAARDRRLAAFRLAGATPRQVRGLGAVEAGWPVLPVAFWPARCTSCSCWQSSSSPGPHGCSRRAMRWTWRPGRS